MAYLLAYTRFCVFLSPGGAWYCIFFAAGWLLVTQVFHHTMWRLFPIEYTHYTSLYDLACTLFFLQELITADTWDDLELHERQKLVRQALRSKAGSTVHKYVREYRKYVNFLKNTKRPYKLPSYHLYIAAYLAHVSQSKHSYHVVLQAFSALKWVHSLLPTTVYGNPADTSLAANILEGSKRAFKKPTVKKHPVSSTTVSIICQRFAGPSADIKGLRLALIFSLGFTGLFQISELLNLQAQDMSFQHEHLEILVRKSKTDQYRQGNTVYIAKTNEPACPHSLLSRFYSLTGIQPGSDAYIFRSLASLARNKAAKLENKPISYTRCREIVKETLAAVGENPACFSTHSLRAGGATAIAVSKACQTEADCFIFKEDGKPIRLRTCISKIL